MKIAAYLATLLVRLLGIYLLLGSVADLIMLTRTGVGHVTNDQLAVIAVIRAGLGGVATLLAGRVVRLFTADAPFGNE
jgi:hypothetical protein